MLHFDTGVVERPDDVGDHACAAFESDAQAAFRSGAQLTELGQDIAAATEISSVGAPTDAFKAVGVPSLTILP